MGMMDIFQSHKNAALNCAKKRFSLSPIQQTMNDNENCCHVHNSRYTLSTYLFYAITIFTHLKL